MEPCPPSLRLLALHTLLWLCVSVVVAVAISKILRSCQLFTQANHSCSLAVEYTVYWSRRAASTFANSESTGGLMQSHHQSTDPLGETNSKIHRLKIFLSSTLCSKDSQLFVSQDCSNGSHANKTSIVQCWKLIARTNPRSLQSHQRIKDHLVLAVFGLELGRSNP